MLRNYVKRKLLPMRMGFASLFFGQMICYLFHKVWPAGFALTLFGAGFALAWLYYLSRTMERDLAVMKEMLTAQQNGAQ